VTLVHSPASCSFIPRVQDWVVSAAQTLINARVLPNADLIVRRRLLRMSSQREFSPEKAPSTQAPTSLP